MPTPEHSAALRISLALLPAASVAIQFLFARTQGTMEFLLGHYTITYVDLAFIPFNYFAACDIDWRRGAGVFALSGLAVIANVAAHASWQATGVDSGQMISSAGVTLAAGWAHVAYATIQMTLVLAFFFLRRPSERKYTPASLFAGVYFLSAGVSGYAMHSAVVATDAVMVAGGVLMLLVSPRFLVPDPARGEAA